METAIVIECGAPEHRAVRHHAACDVLRLHVVTRGARTRFPNDTQVAGIDETNKLPTLAREQRVGPFRIRTTAAPLARIQRPDVRLVFGARDGIASVTRSTTQPNRILAILELIERLSRAVLMHRLNQPMTRHTPLHLHRLLPLHSPDQDQYQDR